MPISSLCAPFNKNHQSACQSALLGFELKLQTLLSRLFSRGRPASPSVLESELYWAKKRAKRTTKRSPIEAAHKRVACSHFVLSPNSGAYEGDGCSHRRLLRSHAVDKVIRLLTLDTFAAKPPHFCLANTRKIRDIAAKLTLQDAPVTFFSFFSVLLHTPVIAQSHCTCTCS